MQFQGERTLPHHESNVVAADAIIGRPCLLPTAACISSDLVEFA